MVMLNVVLRSGVGVLGSACGLLMYGAPIVTIRRVVTKRSSEGYGGMTYVIGMLNCLLYCWYSSPFVSIAWENLVVFCINSIGLILQSCFLSIFITFSPSKTKVRMCAMTVVAVAVFGAVAVCSVVGMPLRNDQNAKEVHIHRKELVGGFGMAATLLLYASPLSNIRVVVKCKNVEYMPFHFCLFAFMGSLLWLIYGALAKDILIMAPNFVGVPLAATQMIIYCVYRKKKDDSEKKKLKQLSSSSDVHVDIESRKEVHSSPLKPTQKQQLCFTTETAAPSTEAKMDASPTILLVSS